MLSAPHKSIRTSHKSLLCRKHTHIHTHTHRERNVRWATCKSAPWPTHITMPASQHSFFYRPDALPATQPTVSKYWRHSTEGTKLIEFNLLQILKLEASDTWSYFSLKHHYSLWVCNAHYVVILQKLLSIRWWRLATVYISLSDSLQCAFLHWVSSVQEIDYIRSK